MFGWLWCSFSKKFVTEEESLLLYSLISASTFLTTPELDGTPSNEVRSSPVWWASTCSFSLFLFFLSSLLFHIWLRISLCYLRVQGYQGESDVLCEAAFGICVRVLPRLLWSSGQTSCCRQCRWPPTPCGCVCCCNGPERHKKYATVFNIDDHPSLVAPSYLEECSYALEILSQGQSVTWWQ